MTVIWVKFYIEALYDPKVGTLPDRLWRRWFELILLAGEQNSEGYLPSVKDMAWKLRQTEDALLVDLQELVWRDLVVLDEGLYRVKNFAKRQKALSAAERASKYRSKQRGTAVYAPVTDSVTERDAKRDETVTKRDADKIREEKNREDGEIDESKQALQLVFSTYESEIGMITATIADSLRLAVEDYPAGWIVDALKESSRQNKRNWSYASAILKRWKAEGRGNGKSSARGGDDLDKYRKLYEQNKQGE